MAICGPNYQLLILVLSKAEGTICRRLAVLKSFVSGLISVWLHINGKLY